MENTKADNTELTSNKLHSFIIRCWTSSDGVQRFRLINAWTGQENLFQDIDQVAKSIKTVLENNTG